VAEDYYAAVEVMEKHLEVSPPEMEDDADPPVNVRACASPEPSNTVGQTGARCPEELGCDGSNMLAAEPRETAGGEAAQSSLTMSVCDWKSIIAKT
jgi:hypothetical protein